MSTVRRFNDGDRIILVFENTSDNEKQEIATFVGKYMMNIDNSNIEPLKTEELPYKGYPGTASSEENVKKDVFNTVNSLEDIVEMKENISDTQNSQAAIESGHTNTEVSNNPPNQKLPNYEFASLAEQNTIASLAGKGARIKFLSEEKARNVVKLSYDDLDYIFSELEKGNFVLDNCSPNDYLKIYSYISTFLMIHKDINPDLKKKLLSYMGYNSDSNLTIINQKIVPVKILRFAN